MNDDKSDEKLVHMAEQIADFFKIYPQQEATAAIAEHINHFWSRQMRQAFLSTYKQKNPQDSLLLQQTLPLIKP